MRTIITFIIVVERKKEIVQTYNSKYTNMVKHDNIGDEMYPFTVNCLNLRPRSSKSQLQLTEIYNKLYTEAITNSSYL